MKYKKPPVKYVVAKICFEKVFGHYSEDKYKKLLKDLESLSLERIVISNANKLRLRQSHDGMEFSQANVERIGFFSANGRRCAIISEQEVEFRLTEYDNHKSFLDDAFSFYNLFIKNGFAVENPIQEIELHYVDHFIPEGCELSDMFNNVTLPVGQFYSKQDDVIKVGVLNFIRVLKSQIEKVQILLEQLSIPKQEDGKPRRLDKVLPDSLIEPDSKLSMPISINFPSSSIGKQYALVHTSGSRLITSDDDGRNIRLYFESLYKESRVTFDNMINSSICSRIWEEEKEI